MRDKISTNFSRTIQFFIMIGGISIFSIQPVQARDPRVDEMDRVKEIAYQLVVDSDDSYLRALGGLRRGIDDEKGIQQLFALKESAAIFYNKVNENQKSPWRTTHAFSEVNSAFSQVSFYLGQGASFPYHQIFFENIVDSVGNLRSYYVYPSEYLQYPDYNVYPYYPGVSGFVYSYSAVVPYYYRNPFCWHLNSRYYQFFPYRRFYPWGQGTIRYPYYWNRGLR
jgi:hypothetical protein